MGWIAFARTESNAARIASSGGTSGKIVVTSDKRNETSITSSVSGSLTLGGNAGGAIVMQMTNRKLWLFISLSLLLGLLIAWGGVRLAPCELQDTRIRGEPTPAPWPTILEQDNHK